MTRLVTTSPEEDFVRSARTGGAYRGAAARWRSLLDRAARRGAPGDKAYDGRFSEERLANENLTRVQRYGEQDTGRVR